MNDTVTAKRDPFSVDEQVADLRHAVDEPVHVLNYTLGIITAIAREGGSFEQTGVSAEKRLEYIRNALAAAKLVQAELRAAGR